MAREAALLGVPSFYTGKRNMKINKELITNKLMFKIDNEEELLGRVMHTTRKRKINSNKIKETYIKKLQDTVRIIVDEVTT